MWPEGDDWQEPAPGDCASLSVLLANIGTISAIRYFRRRVRRGRSPSRSCSRSPSPTS